MPDCNGISCTHFNLVYWFGQKKYLETEKWGQSATPNPAYIIQTHFEVDGKKNTNIEIEENGIIDEYALSLKIENNLDLEDLKNSPKHSRLHAFKDALNFKLAELKIQKKEPRWYLEFLSFIFNEQHTHLPYFLEQVYPYYNRLIDSESEKYDFLKDDLEQLHYRGIVLYYKEINSDLVWLSPSQFAEYVHVHLLSKDVIKSEFGMIDKDKFEKKLLNERETHIIEILKEQKVIFFDQLTNLYIIPGFLQFSLDDKHYKGLSKGESALQFKLMFEKYLPFGFMNQLICFYGSLPDEKWYWKDEIIFFINNIKVQIKLDFCNLEVTVNFIDKAGKNELDSIRNYLFYSIISLYWDHDTLQFEVFKLYTSNILEKENIITSDDPLGFQMENYDNLVKYAGCRPSDLKVSLDGTHFISYQNFWEDCKKDTVTCWIKDTEGNLSIQTTIETESYKHLFKNKYFDFNITKIFKIAISYAKEDNSVELYNYNPIKELFDNLNILARDYYLEIFVDWDIDENDWDRQVREKFNEADLIIVMNSTNYNKIDKRYIWEVEMPIINSKYNDIKISILRINVLDCITSKEVSKFNDFKKGSIPNEYPKRIAFFQNLIKDKVQPQILRYAK